MEPPKTASGRDRKVAIAIITALVLFMGFAISEVHPWGSEPSRAESFDAYWYGVATASDFVSFWTGASLVRVGAGSSLYDMERQHQFQSDLRIDRFTSPGLVGRLDPFHNPPPMALLFLPLTILPLSWAFLTWAALSVTGFVVSVAAPLRSAGSSWTAVSLMLATGAVADAVLWGQADWVFLMALSYGLLALSSGRPLLGGLLLGVLWLKPQYAIVFPMVFLVKRRWQELTGMALTGAVLAVVSVAMIGTDGVIRYLDVLKAVGAYYPPSSSFIFPELMVNWRGLFVNTVPGLSEQVGATLVVAAGGATLLASLLVWRGEWDPRSPRFALQMLAAVAAAVVAAPHSHLHGVTLLFAPLSMAVARRSWEGLPPGVWILFCGAGFILTWVGWLLVPLRWLLAPYLVTLIGALALGPLMGRGECRHELVPASNSGFLPQDGFDTPQSESV